MSADLPADRDMPTSAGLREQAAALHRAQRFAEEEAILRRVIADEPGDARLQFQLGASLTAQGRPAEAEAALRRALDLAPDSAPALGSLARLVRSRDPAAAEALLRRAVAMAPDLAAAHYDLGLLLAGRHRLDEALPHLQRACELRPESPEALNNAGHVLDRLQRTAAAARAFRQALALKPDSFPALFNLGHALSKLGRIDEAEAILRRAVALRPHDAAIHSALLFLLTHKPGPPEALFAEHLAWAERHGPAAAIDPRPHGTDRTPERRLRIGHVSPDFRRHAVAHFIAPLFAAMDRSEVEIVCYSQVERPDAMTERLRGLSGEWHALVGVGDDDAAAMIRGHRIDILVDLAGHTGNHRLALFARKPAPIQATWLGYPGTTGMAAIDYTIGDAVITPPGHERFYTEKIVRLAVSNACYAPASKPDRQARPPALDRGHVTFGSFNRFSKINAAVIAAWAAILHRVPRSRLFLKSVYLGDAEASAYMVACIAAQGIPAERLRLEGMSPPAEYLGRFREVDIGLDPFPYNGGTTTMDTLAMGVPLVVLRGDRRAGLTSTSRMLALGLDELCVESVPAYVDKAVALAQDPDGLAALRRRIGERFDGSTLADPVPFARSLEAAYRAMWRRWCAGLPPQGLDVPAPSGAAAPLAAIDTGLP